MIRINCAGSPREIGYQHGFSARQQVHGSIEFYKGFFHETAHIDWDEACETAAKWLSYLEKWPDLVSEMKGLASGASVPFLSVLALNVRTEIAYGLYSDGCTALAYHTQRASILAQNWDWRSSQAKNLIHLVINKRIAMVTEAGIIGKIGLNSDGIGVCLNAIRAAGVSYDRLPVHLALRVALNQRRLNTVVELLESTGVASSAHILLADTTSAIGLETSYHDVQKVEPTDFALTHTNHYLKTEEVSYLPDSTARLCRINELIGEDMDSEEVGRALQDEQGYPYSICRDATSSDETMTLFSIVMDLKKRTGRVKLGRPVNDGEFLNNFNACFKPTQLDQNVYGKMIGTSLYEYVFIRVCIFLLRYFAPLLIASLVLTLIVDHSAHRITLILQILSIAEVIFYVLVYIPKNRSLQKPAVHPHVLPYPERQRLFNKGHENFTDVEDSLPKWFNGAPLSQIKRDNVKEFYCWAMLSKAVWGLDDEEELDGYADKIEELLGRKLEPGRGSAVALRLTVDPVNMLHRPLVWYMIVAFVDCMTYLYLNFQGFQFHRLRLSRILTVFPFRLITLSARRTTPSNTLSYWHRPHTSRSRHPILFIHGIGIGLYPYARFLSAINQSRRDADGQVGIIAIELMPISFRITGEMPDQSRLCSDILEILEKHGWEKVVLISHSYGSVITTAMLKHELLSQKIGHLMLVDPVAFMLQLPDVAYNFTRRPPKRANEHQLYYFASTDMCVAHTLARHFFWVQNILWKEDLKDRNVTVTLGGRDLIVNTLAVGRYLTQDERRYENFLAEDEGEGELRDSWQERSWKGECLDVLWFPHCDHAQIFDNRRDYWRLVDIARAYSTQTD